MEIPYNEPVEKEINRNYAHFSMLAETEPEKLISLKDLLGQAGIDSILAKLFELYPAEAGFDSDYRRFYGTLAAMEPNTAQKAYITIDKFLIDSDNDETDIEEPANVVRSDMVGFDAETGDDLNLEWFGWDVWLGFLADTDEVAEIGADAFLAYCFYKMTINGYTKEDILANLERKSGDPDANKLIFGSKRNSTFPGINMANPLSQGMEDDPAVKPQKSPFTTVLLAFVILLAVAVYVLLTQFRIFG